MWKDLWDPHTLKLEGGRAHTPSALLSARMSEANQAWPEDHGAMATCGVPHGIHK